MLVRKDKHKIILMSIRTILCDTPALLGPSTFAAMGISSGNPQHAPIRARAKSSGAAMIRVNVGEYFKRMLNNELFRTTLSNTYKEKDLWINMYWLIKGGKNLNFYTLIDKTIWEKYYETPK